MSDTAPASSGLRQQDMPLATTSASANPGITMDSIIFSRHPNSAGSTDGWLHVAEGEVYNAETNQRRSGSQSPYNLVHSGPELGRGIADEEAAEGTNIPQSEAATSDQGDVVDNLQEVVEPVEEPRSPTGYPEGPLDFAVPWNNFTGDEWREFAGRVFGLDPHTEPMELRRLETNVQAVPHASRAPSPDPEAEAQPRRRTLILLDGSSEASIVSIDSLTDSEESSDDELREHLPHLVETVGATPADRSHRIMDWMEHDRDIQTDTDSSSSLDWSDSTSTDGDTDDPEDEEEEDVYLDLFETDLSSSSSSSSSSNSQSTTGSDSLLPSEFSDDAHASDSVAGRDESGRNFGDDSGTSGARPNDVSDFRAAPNGESSVQGSDREGRLLHPRAAFDDVGGSNARADIPSASPLFGEAPGLLKPATDVPQDKKGKDIAVPENSVLDRNIGPAEPPGFVTDSGPAAPVPEIVGLSEDTQVLEAAHEPSRENASRAGSPSRSHSDWRTDISILPNVIDDDELLLGDSQRRAEPWPPRVQDHDAPYYSEEEFGDARPSDGGRYRNFSDSWLEQSSDDCFRSVPSRTSSLTAERPSLPQQPRENIPLPAMSIWTAPLSEPDDWASTLAAIPAQLDLPADARWHEHPRVSRYAHRRLNAPLPRTAAPTAAPTLPPPSKYQGRQKRRLCYPRFRRSATEGEEDIPLPWEKARIIVDACITQHYQGAFPVTLAEFARVQEFLDAGDRGREPLRQHQAWHDSQQWKFFWRDRIIFEDLREMVESWGDECDGLVRYRDLARLVFAKQTKEIPAELEKDEMEGYIGDSEDEGGKDGGPFGWQQQNHYNIIPRTAEQREERSPWPFREEMPDPELGYDDSDEDCGKCGCIMCIRLRTADPWITESGTSTDLEHKEGYKQCKCKQCEQAENKQAETPHADNLETHGGQLLE